MQSTSPAIDLDSFNSLVSDIYDTTLDQARWPVVLERVCRALNSRSGLIRVQDMGTKEIGTYITHGLDPAFRQQYKEHYIQIDPLIPAIAQQPVGSIQPVTTLMPGSFFKSEFYNDYALPQGQAYTLGCILTRNRSQLAILGLHRPNRRGDYQPKESVLLGLLIPHLQRAVRLGQHLRQLSSEVNASQEALHRITIGVILVDASGTPLFLNKQAEAFIAAGQGLTISRNSLRAPTWAQTQALHKLIFEAAQAARKTGGGMSISTLEMAQPLSILVTPVGKEPSNGFRLDNSCVAAALFIGTAGQQLEFSLDALSLLYGLTRTEARLAAALANGLSLEMMAGQFGRSLHTLRSQLKSCFRKTGTHRQTELVKLVLCAPAAILGTENNG